MRGLIYMIIGVISVSCTGRFKDLNTDKTGITDENMQVDLNHLGIPLDVIQQGIYFNYDYGKGKNWPYQLMQNLSADMFSGYMHDYKPLNGGSHNSDYNLQDGWNGTLWENTYAYIMPQIKRLEDSTRLKYPAVYAVTEILKVEVMHRVSDYYGPVIYTSFGNKKMIYQPDTQQDVYHYFLDDLKTAVGILENYVNLADYTPEFSRFDLLLDGKVESWIRFANSLRLRLAIRMAMADPDKARQEFADALAGPLGVFEEPTQLVAVTTDEEYSNPLGEINRVWGEVYMNASMESILNGFDDPRREAFFEPCPDDVLLPDRAVPGNSPGNHVCPHALFRSVENIRECPDKTDSDDGSRGLVSAGGSRFAGMDCRGPQNLLRAGYPVFILPVAGGRRGNLFAE